MAIFFVIKERRKNKFSFRLVLFSLYFTKFSLSRMLSGHVDFGSYKEKRTSREYTFILFLILKEEEIITSRFGRLLLPLFSSSKTVIYPDKLPLSRRKLRTK